ncbi:MBL fold metallo-hydrolase [Stenotrophomonas maltophilia]|uniref:MBL fold metallo-hydrolase n=1 Tax=Stenotrophomonas maltophilia TaxID=40324 RepID=UPI0039C16079
MKMFKRLLVSMLAVAALTAGVVIIYLQQPVFGALPQGERLEQIALSPNYIGGSFLNQIETTVKTTDQSEVSMWMQTLFGDRGQTRPSRDIPSVKTNLKALDASKDLVIWLGHSTYFIQMSGQRVLIDPVFSANAAPVPGALRAFDGTNLYTADDLPDIDALLISHDHYDHLDYPTVRELRPKVRQVIVGLGVGAHFERWGYDMGVVHEVDWSEVVKLTSQVHVHVTPARHFSGRTLTRNQSLWVGFVLTSPQRRLFFSGDSGYGPHFAEIGRRFGSFDWVALDAGQYDPRWANVHMNPEEAAQAADDLHTDVLMQAHVGRFTIAPHDWEDPFRRIVAATHGRNYTLWTPEIGRPAYLDGRTQKFVAWWEGRAKSQPDREQAH